jgi:hypothetical protein
MRLAAQVRGGFYPAHEKVVAHAASFLQAPPAGAGFTILDPCAGTGAAIQQLGEILGCVPEHLFAIELDDSRAEAVHQTLPEGHILAPADFFGCRAGWNSFPFIWLNPPFDDSYGGHRVEERFLWRATDWLLPGGVIALVCPEDVFNEYSDVRRYFTSHYQQCQIVPFPEPYRPFREVIVFGHKRPRPEGDQSGTGDRFSWDSVRAPKDFCYRIPPGNGPRVFQKVEPTESELQRMVACSPLGNHLSSPPELPVPSPPLALGIGHVALLLASGHLNGVVHPEGQPPHVVRGTSRKYSFVSDVTDTENADGSVTTRTTISERIELVVRTVDHTGRIRTFNESDAKEE